MIPQNQLSETQSTSLDASISECPHCASRNFANLGPCRQPEQRNTLPKAELLTAKSFNCSELLLCRNCFLCFRSPMPNAEQIAQMYDSLPATRWATGVNEVSSWNIAINWLASKFTSEQKISVLDVGTFDGRFLTELPERWQKYCLEPSRSNWAQLEAKGIHRVGQFIQDLQASSAPQFDVITMFDVFEHLNEPRRSLSKLVAQLKPGGYLIISTGNQEHWSWMLRGNHWYMQTIQHLIVGSLSYFRRAAAELGCRMEYSQRHSHLRHTKFQILRQAIETIIFAWRKEQGFRHLLASGMLLLPGFRYLVHKVNAPHGSGLADHLLIVVQSSQHHNFEPETKS